MGCQVIKKNVKEKKYQYHISVTLLTNGNMDDY